MGTEVLRQENCLVNGFRFTPPLFQRDSDGQDRGNANSGRGRFRKPLSRPQPERRVTGLPDFAVSKRSSSFDNLRAVNGPHVNNRHAKIRKVTTLRRGDSCDSLDSKIISGRRSLVRGDEHSGGNARALELEPKHVRLSTEASYGAGGSLRSNVYAGSAFCVSPSPKELPLPSFFSKKTATNSVDDSATRDLRRLLQLD